MISRYCLFFHFPIMHRKGHVLGCLNGFWRCLDGVWGCLDGVLQCLGMYQYRINRQNFIQVHYTQIFSFLPVPSKAQNCLFLGVSGCCLEMSGWCVQVSWGVSIPNAMAKTHISSDIAFSTNAL